ncbi:MAG: glycine cleavage system protein H [Gammaproteobacteria bacterium]|nr:MAG: glycine cleavage system protein H [Gammaproteobacteria bacterium]
MECHGCEFRPELYYDDEYQIWVRKEDDGTLTIGMTDLAQTIAGKILHVRVRKPGTRRPPGKPVATLESGKWAGPIPNYFDCTIKEANEAVLRDPSLLNRDPYGAWVARVIPTEGADEALKGFHTGEAAFEGYCRQVEAKGVTCQRLT